MRLVAFCEARSDFEISADLADRVIREKGPTWLADLLDGAREEARVWLGDGRGHPFFDLHRVDRYASDLGFRRPHGHFDGAPGAAGSLMARTAFRIVRELIQRGESIDVAVIVWDMDDEAQERRAGLAQARNEARRWATFEIVVGSPNAMREAWVLVGFEPADDDESARFAELRRELGCAPNTDAHLLDASDETAPRSAKRVLRVLSADDRERERRCWTATPLETLIARSANTGLREYLEEVEANLLPRCIATRR